MSNADPMIPLPFECPDLVMPISGKLKAKSDGGGFEYTSLVEIEKKLLLGLKLSLSPEIGLTSEQWVVWMAYKKDFILHMWNPNTGELKKFQMKNSTLLPSFGEDGAITHLRVTSEDSSFVINGNGCDFMKELSELLELSAQALSSAPKKNSTPTVPQVVKTASKEDLLRDSLGNRDSDPGPALTPEDLEKQRKRRAIGSVSMRRLSLTGRGTAGSKKHDHSSAHSPGHPDEQEEIDLPPPPEERPQMVNRRSLMSSVFGSITEDAEAND